MPAVPDAREGESSQNTLNQACPLPPSVSLSVRGMSACFGAGLEEGSYSHVKKSPMEIGEIAFNHI